MLAKIKFLFITIFCVFSAAIAFMFSYSVFYSTPKLEIVEEHIEDTNAVSRGINASEASASDSNNPDKEEAAVNSLEVFTGEDKINENTNIVYEYYYIADGKTRKAEQKAPYPLLNLTRSQLLGKIEGWRVVSFSSKEVVLRKNIEATPTGTYILGIWNDHVAVFHGGQTSGTGLMEVTDTPVSALSADEYQRLTEGIIINTESELMKVLEDYGS